MSHNDFTHLLGSLKALSAGSGAEASTAARQRACTAGEADRSTASGRVAKRSNASSPKKQMTEAEFDQHLLKIGLISSLPDPALDIDDEYPDDAPVTIKGEPLSETIIRDRR